MTRRIDLTQLAQRNADDACAKGRNGLPRKQPLGLTIPERLDHTSIVYRLALLTQAVKLLHYQIQPFPCADEPQQRSRAAPSRDPATASIKRN